jgi:hypothetical protein
MLKDNHELYREVRIVERILVGGEKVPRRAFDSTEENNNNAEIQVHRR